MQYHINDFVKNSLLPSLFKNEIKEHDINNNVSVFSYGSSVYGNKKASDYDYIVVSEYKKEQFEDVFAIKGHTVNIQLTFYSNEEFLNMLKINEIAALECFSLSSIAYYRKYSNKKNVFQKDNMVLSHLTDKLVLMIEKLMDNDEDRFVLPSLLRTSISQKSSNSYVKAKKKIILKDDFDLMCSLKSLWHSFRMIGFALQITQEEQEIEYFDIANELYQEILNDYATFYSYKDPEEFWLFIHSKYQPRHNALMSVFRKYAPKEGFSTETPLNINQLHNIINNGYLIDPMVAFNLKNNIDEYNEDVIF